MGRSRRLKWQDFNDTCDYCGDEAEVLTDTGYDNCALDGDEARCVSCRQPGYVSVDEEGSAHIHWHGDATCECEWCKMCRAEDNAYAMGKKLKGLEAETVRLQAIVDKLVDEAPIIALEHGPPICGYCEETMPADWTIASHLPTCPWRLAVEAAEEKT